MEKEALKVTKQEKLFIPLAVAALAAYGVSTGGAVPGSVLSGAGSFLLLWGVFKTACLLHSSPAGWLSAAALFASSLFLDHCLKPVPSTVFAAAAVWSLFFYMKESYGRAALVCALGGLFSQQAVFLAAAFFSAELLETGFRKPRRLLLALSPALAPVVPMVMNGESFTVVSLSPDSAVNTLRMLGAELFSRDFRWVLFTAAAAGIFRDRGRDTHSIPFILALLFPGLFYPPERLLFSVFILFAAGVFLVRERLYTTRISTVFLLFPAFFVTLHALSGGPAPGVLLPVLSFVLLAGAGMVFRYYSRTAAVAVMLTYTAASIIA